MKHKWIIAWVFFFVLVDIIVMLNKVKWNYDYDPIQKASVQAIRQIHCYFLYGIPEITSVWRFDGRRIFLQVNICCKNILDVHNIIDSALGVPVIFLLDWIKVCSIPDYITCLKCVSIFLQFVQRYVPLYNIISMCFVFVCNNSSIPVF